MPFFFIYSQQSTYATINQLLYTCKPSHVDKFKGPSSVPPLIHPDAHPSPSPLSIIIVQDDTFDDSSLFSGGSEGSAYAAGYRQRHNGSGAFPSSPSAIGIADNTSDEDYEDEDDLKDRWGTDRSVISGYGGDMKVLSPASHVRETSFFYFFWRDCFFGGGTGLCF